MAGMSLGRDDTLRKATRFPSNARAPAMANANQASRHEPPLRLRRIAVAPAAATPRLVPVLTIDSAAGLASSRTSRLMMLLNGDQAKPALVIARKTPTVRTGRLGARATSPAPSVAARRPRRTGSLGPRRDSIA